MSRPKGKRPRTALVRGLSVVWPAGLEAMLGCSAVTRWRRERDGSIPPRDVKLGASSGWRPETIERFLAESANCGAYVANANARLTAAAPELLEALRTIRVELWGMAEGPLQGTPAEHWLRDAGRRADAALQKAGL